MPNDRPFHYPSFNLFICIWTLVAGVLCLVSGVTISGVAKSSESAYLLTLKQDGKSYHGKMTVTREDQEYHQALRFQRVSAGDWPEEVFLPNVEEVERGGGLTFSKTEPPLKSEMGESLIRVSEYGTYIDLEKRVYEIAFQNEEYGEKGDTREYRSAFLLLNDPAAISRATVNKQGANDEVLLNMADGSQLYFLLDQKKAITEFGVQKSGASLSYQLNPSD